MSDLESLKAYAGDLSAAASKSTAAAAQQHKYINGDDQTDVNTESGPVPTLAKQARLYSEAIPDAVGQLSAQMADGKIHNTEEEGRLAVADGVYFYVKSTNPASISRSLYRRLSATSSIHIVDDPSAAFVNALDGRLVTAESSVSGVKELISSAGDDAINPFEMVDNLKFILMQMLVDGTFDLPACQIKTVGDGLELSDSNNFLFARVGLGESNINGLVPQAIPVPGMEWCDQNNFILARIGGDKTYFGLPVEGGQQLVPTPMAVEINRQVRTGYIQVLNYGQSLSDGQNAKPSVSTVQEYGNLMLAGGVNVRPGEPGYVANRLVPLVEKDNGARGETPVSGLCNGLVRRATADGELIADWTIVGTACGRGGKSVEELSPAPLGEGYYEKMIQMVKDVNATALAAGKTHSVWAYTWDQGESNYTLGSTKSAYQYTQYMMNIFDQLTREVVDITGQKFRPYLFTYQVAAHRKYDLDHMSIALAQWRLSRQREDVVMAVPAYILPTGSDLLHLTNEAAWLLGEYRSRAMYETMIRRSGKWRPLEPVSVDWQSDHIDIKFHVPGGDLVLDDSLAAMAPNFGFDIRDGAVLKEGAIANVAVIGRDTVRLTLAEAIGPNGVVSYARGRQGDLKGSGPVSGARGNLRDTHGLFDTATSPLGNTFALHNPCVMFQYDRKTGF
ncbi:MULTISPECIES: sialate O-acetylesterase [Pseudomonas]|uniref:Sialate O-acetylesterase domain-containing protein n=1 Tax=Pseudomonas putida S13.1.2 TaxID=1384061 RepID=A0AAU8RXE2_PSEPU|nr:MULTISPECIES: sialate O-acetylesterase [Pseudomonas]AJQ47964.1 hypothetical protein N805_12370 [Pseudomonas putida S13.1.2]